jgi:hypothetical protein
MVPPPYAAEPGNWFLRGVQSAVFYYISCTPWVEFKHRRKRRREAKEQAQTGTEIIVTQPGLLRQPAPFQTNEAWAEELMLGPGPPKGWKKDTLLQRVQNKVRGEPNEPSIAPEMPELHPQHTESSLRPSTHTEQPTESSTRLSSTTNDSDDRSFTGQKDASTTSRPPIERRLSNAMENIKESLRTSLHPPKWNWKRYDREDEILAGFTERVTRIWNRATSGMHHEEMGEREEEGESSYRRARALTNESERYDYHRARHPEVNDLHPPIVSQLPATRAEAAWMLLPPPSAALMEARTRPAAEQEMRWPLCVIGRTPKPTMPTLSMAKTRSTDQIDTRDFGHSSEEEGEADSVLSADDLNLDENRHEEGFRGVGKSPLRVKHLSDPIVRPPSIHPVSRIAGDLFLPKRRDSWQFHYVIPSNQPTGW